MAGIMKFNAIKSLLELDGCVETINRGKQILKMFIFQQDFIFRCGYDIRTSLHFLILISYDNLIEPFFQSDIYKL